MSEMVARLDDYGRPAWIAVMVLGFVLFWPVGLAILAYMLWSGRMSWGCSGRNRSQNRSEWQNRFADKFGDKFDKARSRVEDEVRNFSGGFGPAYSSGNAAFDDYRQATLKRLEEEEREFRTFLDRLRKAKDKSEFDAFMSERRDRPAPAAPETPATDQPQT
ncbi:MAG: DUF2852 domain-containing protein [Hyphomicrobium sp.]|nr:DUF2852 domain-containing protein [Hyphomicrobium sp.]